MKKISILIIIFILLNSLTVFGENLNLNGQNYILMEELSGRILKEQNSNKKMPMASTTKIMTAIIALEMGNLEDLVEIKGDEVNIEGSSIYLKDGEKVKLIDLIYGLMLRSGNDAALAIANHISGSEEEFVKLMNKKAKEIGAYNTNFTNPHGLSNENHFSTAYDLAIITRYSFKNKIFEEISKSKNYRSERETNNYYVNKNKTLWEYEGGDGVKIGYTINSGRCLVSSASRDNMRLIAVTLNNYDWFNDCYKLFDYGFNNYTLKKVYDKGQLIKQINIKNGDKEILPLVAENEFAYPLLDSEKDKVKVVVNTIENVLAPINIGDKLGSIEVFVDGKLIGKDNLVAKLEIEKLNLLQKILKSIRNKNS